MESSDIGAVSLTKERKTMDGCVESVLTYKLTIYEMRRQCSEEKNAELD